MGAMATDGPREVRLHDLVLLTVLAAVWGASFLFIKVALEDVGPLFVVAARLAVGAGGIGGWAVLTRGRSGFARMLRGARPADVLILAVTASALPFTLIAWAETEITASLAGILNAAVPLLTALLACRLAPTTRLRGWRSGGLLVGFVGVALTVGTDLGGKGRGVAAMLGAVVLYAVGAHLARLRFAQVEPLGVAFVQIATAAIIVVPLALVVDRPTRVPPADTIAALGALGLGGTALGFILFYRLIAEIGPQHSVAVTYLAPIFAVGYGVVLLHEHVTPAALAGIALVIAGQVITVLPPRNGADALVVMEEAAA